MLIWSEQFTVLKGTFCSIRLWNISDLAAPCWWKWTHSRSDSGVLLCVSLLSRVILVADVADMSPAKIIQQGNKSNTILWREYLAQETWDWIHLKLVSRSKSHPINQETEVGIYIKPVIQSKTLLLQEMQAGEEQWQPPDFNIIASFFVRRQPINTSEEKWSARKSGWK